LIVDASSVATSSGGDVASSVPLLAVVPTLDCVSPVPSQPGAFIAWLGYENFNPISLTIPVGASNQFVSTPSPLNRAPFIPGPSPSTTRVTSDLYQPTKFVPGRVAKLFSVTFTQASAITWVLSNTLSNQAINYVDIVSTYSVACTGTETAYDPTAGSGSSSNSSSSGQLVCQCLTGFWGPTCDFICPQDIGGGLSCSDHGSCSTTTGACTCEERWSGPDTNALQQSRRSIVDHSNNHHHNMTHSVARRISDYSNQHIPVQPYNTFVPYVTHCSICSNGYVGADCSVAVVELPARYSPVLGVYGHGHFMTFDGAMFDYRGVAILQMFLSRDRQVEIQIRQVSCEEGRTVCVTAAAVRIDTVSLVIHAPYETGGSITVWRNGQLVPMGSEGQLDPSIVTGDFVLQRVSLLEYNLTSISNQFVLNFRIQHRQLALSLQLSQSACSGSSGMLGSCNVDAKDDLRLGLTSAAGFLVADSTSATPANRLMTQQNIHNVFAPVWTIAPAQANMFSVIYDFGGYFEQPVATGAGFALLFNNTGATSNPLFTFSNGDVTLEFLVKAFDHGGVLLSFATSLTLAIIDSLGCNVAVTPCPAGNLYYSLKIQFGTDIYDTAVSLDLDKWNQISLVWKAASDGAGGILQFYFFSSVGLVTSKTLVLSTSPLIPGGTLSVGQWAYGTISAGNPPPGSFVGIIDEIRLWNRWFDQQSLSANYMSNLVPSTPGLASMWKLDEGEGDYVADLVSPIPCDSIAASAPCLYLPSSALYLVPKWVFSDAPLSLLVSSLSEVYTTTWNNDVSLQSSAVNLCNSLFLSQQSPLVGLCADLGLSERQFLYENCLYDISTGRELGSSLPEATFFGDQCQALFTEVPAWPAQFVCQYFPSAEVFPDWIGANCRKRCIFGQQPSNAPSGTCVCVPGYWGPDCGQGCPGGVVTPCNNHGVCRPLTGSCLCEPDWQGDGQCSTCTPGWTGADCSIAVTQLPDVFLPVWSVFGEGHFTSLSGKNFDFSGVGVYELSISPDQSFKVVSRQVTCQYSSMSCSQAVSVYILGHYITIEAPILVSNSPVLKVDGVITNAFQAVEVPAGSGYFLTQSSSTNFILSGVDSLKLTVTVNGRFSDIVCQVSRDYCAASTGVMGTCDPTDDATRTNVEEYSGQYTTCTEFGQAHFITFDNATYSFPGQCTYLLASLQALNGTIDVKVYVTHTSCLTGQCVSEVIVILPGMSFIRMLSDGATFVGGTSVVTFPYKLINSHKISRTAETTTVHAFASIVLITYSVDGRVVVSAASSLFANHSSGLCGNFNHLASDDLNGMSPYSFGVSQVMQLPSTVACADPVTPPPVPPCRNMTFATQYCSALLSSKYSPCVGTVDPTSYYNACISDACAVQSYSTGLSLACLSYSSYESACLRAGVQGVESIVDDCGECFGDGSSCFANSGVCSIFGNAMFSTFDDKVAYFPGSCDYTLAKDCAQGDFDVQVRLVNCFGGKCVGALGVRTPGNHLLELNTLGVVKVDGATIMALPYALNDNTIILSALNGLSVHMREINVQVTWIFGSRVQVVVPDWYQTRTCGLCGTFDGNAGNDFFVNTPLQADLTWLYGTNWKVGSYSHILDDYNVSCIDSSTPPPLCQVSLMSNALSALCTPLNDPFGVYSSCFDSVTPTDTYNACLSSVCAHQTDGLAILSASSTMLVYEDMCVQVDDPTGTTIDECGVLNGDGSTCAAAFSYCTLFDLGAIVPFGGSLTTVLGTCSYTVVSFGFVNVVMQRDAQSRIVSVSLNIGGDSTTLLSSGAVVFNGEQLYANSLLSGDMVIQRQANGARAFSRTQGIIVEYLAGIYSVQVRSAILREVQGLCKSVASPSDWALSSTPSSCTGTTPPPVSPACLASTEAATACRGLNSLVYENDCFEHVNASEYLATCLEQYCRQENSCAVLQAYDTICESMNYPHSSVVDACGECYGDGLSCLPTRTYFTCHAWGDPHYTTFSGLRYDFQGSCDFVVTTLLSPPLVSLANLSAVMPGPFEIHARHGSCGANVQCMFGAAIRVGDTVIEFSRTQASYLNGSLIEQYPVNFPNGRLTAITSTERRVILFGGSIVIDWTPGSYALTVRADESYKGLLAGLCGYLGSVRNVATSVVSSNGVPANATSNAGLFPFLMSWAVPSSTTLFRTNRSTACSNVPLPDPPACNTNVQRSVSQMCSMLSDANGRYATCQGLVDSSFVSDACVFDACVADVPSVSVCNTIKEYESMCLVAGGNGFASVVDQCGVCFGDGSSCVAERKTCTVSQWSNVLTFSGNLYRTNASQCSSVLLDADYSFGRSLRLTVEYGSTANAVMLRLWTAYDQAILMKSGEFIVNGNRILASPYTTANGLRLSLSSDRQTITLAVGSDLTLNWLLSLDVLQLTINSDVGSSIISGLCGLYSASRTAELTSINSGFGSLQAFAFASRLPTGNCSVPSIQCQPVATDPFAQQCNLLTDATGPVAQCHSAVDPTPYLAICLAESCIATTPCTIFESYRAACQQAGVSLPASVDRCGVCLGDGSSCSSDYDICLSFGDNHLANFGGNLFDAVSTCDTILAQDCRAFGDYSIVALNSSNGGGVRATLFGYSVSAFSNGTILTSAVVLSAIPIRVETDVGVVRLIASPYFQVSYSISTDAIELSLSSAWASSTCGQCSRATSIPSVSSTSSGRCNTTSRSVASTCNSTSLKLNGLRYCDMLSDPTNILGGCFDTINPQSFFDACVSDYCSGRQDLSLLTIETYYSLCVRSNVHRIQRPTDICGVLNGDDTTCPQTTATCSVIGSAGFITYVEQNVAFGTPGMYSLTQSCLNDQFTVVITRPEMSSSGLTHPTIEIRRLNKPTVTVMPFNTQYTAASAARADWVVAAILGVNRLTVQPLFDQLFVLVNNAAIQPTVTIYPGDVITLLSGHVLVDGSSLLSLPYSFSDGTSIALSASDITVRLETGLTLKYFKSGLVLALVPNSMQGGLCGLCGTYDESTAAWLYLRNTSSIPAVGQPNQFVFGSSWSIANTVLPTTQPTVQPPLGNCTAVSVETNEVCSLFSGSNSSTYSACFNTINPALYASACGNAVCTSHEPCDLAKSYEAACSNAGVSLVSVVDSCGQCFGDGSSCSGSISTCSLWADNVLFMTGGSVRMNGNALHYTFASDCGSALFNIELRYQSSAAALAAIAISFGGSNTLFLFVNGTAQYNNDLLNLANTIALPHGSSLSGIGTSYEVLIQPYGITFTWDLDINTITLTSPLSYVRSICGLCNSGVNSNIPLGPLGNMTATQCRANPGTCLTAIPPSWVVRPQDELFPGPFTSNHTLGQSVCNATLLPLAESYCSVIKSSDGPYGNCLEVLDATAYYNACVEDYCLLGSSCAAYSLFERACRSAGVVRTASVVDECGVCFGDGSSCALQFSSASVWGDPHYSTLDGAVMSVEGSCDYVLVNDCVSHSFEVQVLQRNVSSHVRLVGLGVRSPSDTVELYPNNRILLNGALVSELPWMTEDGSTISLTADGLVRVFLSGSRTVVLWDNVGAASVKVLESYYGKTCGLVGFNYDGQEWNDLNRSSTNVSVVDQWRFAQSFLVGRGQHILSEATDACLNNPPPLTPPVTCSTAQATAAAEAACAVLADWQGPLAACFPRVPPQGYFSTCLVDYCVDGTPAPSILAYQQQCVSRGVVTPEVVDRCGVVNGDGSSCIQNYGTCLAFATHLYSFDGLGIDFSGACSYYLVEDCEMQGFQVQMRRTGLDGFVVDIRKLGRTVELTPTTALVDGSVVSSFPLTLADGMTLRRTAQGLQVDLGNEMTVMYSREKVVEVTASRYWMGRTCGLCGPFNGMPAENLVLSNGRVLPSPTRSRNYQFGISWAVPAGLLLSPSAASSCVDNEVPTPEACVLASSAVVSASAGACNVLHDPAGPYAGCFETVPVVYFYQACVQDYCMFGGNMSALRPSLIAYEEICRLNMPVSPIRSVIDRCGVVYGDGSSCRQLYGTSGVRAGGVFSTFEGFPFVTRLATDLYLSWDPTSRATFSVQIRQSCSTAPCMYPQVQQIGLREPSMGVVEVAASGQVVVNGVLYTALPMVLYGGTRLWLDAFDVLHVVLGYSGV